MKTRLLILTVIAIIVISAIVVGFFILSSNDQQYSKENPYGFKARVFYDPHFLPIMCPTQDGCSTHLQLSINSEIPAVLKGYKICNGYSCVIQDSIHFSTNDSAIIPIFDNNKWNIGDKISIKVQVETQYDETYTHHPPPIPFFIDLGESEIAEIGVILSTDTTCSETSNLEIAKIPKVGEPSRLVFSVKQNTTAHICIRYTSNLDNEGTLNLNAESYNGYLGTYNGTKSNVSVTINPSFIPLQKGQSTIVDYVISVPQDADGVYWLGVSQMCDRIPIVTSNHKIIPDDIPVIVGMHGCPPISLDAKIIGYSNADVQYHMAKALPGR